MTAMTVPAPPQLSPREQKLVQSGEIRTLRIRDLKFCMDENNLPTSLARTCEVLSVQVSCNKESGQSEGYRFIEFVIRAAAKRESVLPNSEQNVRLNKSSVSACKKRFVGTPDFTIFVGDLAAHVTCYLLQETFGACYSTVMGATIVIERLCRRTKGYVFVRFGDESEQLRAITAINRVFCSTRPKRIRPRTNRKTVAVQQQYLKGCEEAPSSFGVELILPERVITRTKRAAESLMFSSIKKKKVSAVGKECNNKTSDPIVGPILPYDIIFEVLSWLPAKPLLSFKRVCKQWYYLIQDRKFITQHLSRSIFVVIHCEREVTGFNIDGTIQEKFSKMHSFGGIVVEKGNVSKKYRIRNITTHQVLHLPDPHQGTFSMYLTNCHTNNSEFKLVSIYGNPESCKVEGLDILTIERDDKWRHLKLFPNFKEYEGFELVKTDGGIHLVTKFEDGSKKYMVSYSLDMESECFFNNALPYVNRIRLIDWDGCLTCLPSVDLVEENMKVIVLEDFKKQRWNEFVVPLTFLKEEENQDMKKNLVLHSFDQGKLWFTSNKEKILVYDLQLRKITDVVPIQLGHKYAFSFQPSLVTFKGMHPEQIHLNPFSFPI